MKIYIASTYSSRFALRPIAEELRSYGHEITAQWLDNAEESKGQAAAAQMDIDDIDRADAVLFFAQPAGSFNSGGGRYFELGYAYAKGKRVMIVQPGLNYETVFGALPTFATYADAASAIRAIERGQ